MTMGHYRRVGLLAPVLALALLSACSSGGSGDAAGAAVGPGGGDAAAAPSSVLPAPVDTTSPPPKIEFTRTIGPGDKGPEVAYLQQRLQQLHFDPGPLDGAYGSSVQSAVWAYQQLIGLTGDDVTGEVTPELWSRLQDPFPLPPMIPHPGTHVEVYLPWQVLVLFQDDQPRLITHVSTGNDQDWCEKGVCGVAVTPGGAYEFQRRVSGWRQAELGLLYNPVYFNGGIAVHGALSVPQHAASHGCVRIPMHIADYFPTLVNDGDAVYVFDGVKDPREYGAQAPPPNRKDPNYVGPDVTFDDRDQTTNTVAGPAATAPDDSATSLPEITAPATSRPKSTTTTTEAAPADTTPPAEPSTTAAAGDGAGG